MGQLPWMRSTGACMASTLAAEASPATLALGARVVIETEEAKTLARFSQLLLHAMRWEIATRSLASRTWILASSCTRPMGRLCKFSVRTTAKKIFRNRQKRIFRNECGAAPSSHS